MSNRRGQGGRGGATTSNGSEMVISPDAPALEAALQELQQAIRQITPLLPRGGAFARLYKEFTVLGGSTFDGNESPIEVNDWLCLCERVFEKMEATELQKRELAVHQLRSAAASWWKMTCLGVDEGTIVWDEFKRRFEARFVPTTLKNTLFNSFVNLKQDEAMTVTEYTNKFDQLSVYGADFISRPSSKIEKFVSGLLPSIQTPVRGYYCCTFDEALDVALFTEYVEASRDEGVKPRRSRDCRFQPYVRRSQSSENENVRCFKCGKMGHYGYGCPEKGSGSQS